MGASISDPSINISGFRRSTPELLPFFNDFMAKITSPISNLQSSASERLLGSSRRKSSADKVDRLSFLPLIFRISLQNLRGWVFDNSCSVFFFFFFAFV